MQKSFRLLAVLFSLLLTMATVGCTVYPEKKPSLNNTTSAEQHERLYWEAVRKQDWNQVVALQAPSVVYATRTGELVDGTRWIAVLKSAPLGDYSIGQMQVRPQGNDMALSYVTDVAGQQGSAVTHLAVTSVWQQLKGGWVLIAHSETPQAAAMQ